MKLMANRDAMRWTSLIIALALSESLCAAAFDTAQFNGLPEDQRQTFVMAVIARRDTALRNLEYNANVVIENVRRQDGARRFMTRSAYTFRRFGDDVWIHLTRFEYYKKEGGKVTSDGFVAWDGEATRSLSVPPYTHTQYPEGTIDSRENTIFSYGDWSTFFGFKIRLERGDPITVLEWIKNAISEGRPSSIVAFSQDEIPFISITMARPHYEQSIWLRPDRDFMIARLSSGYKNIGSNGSTTTVTDARQIQQTWLPSKMIRHSGTSTSDEDTEMTWSLDECKLGGLQSHDTEIIFPVGTKVIDVPRNVGYFVLDGGHFRLINLADERSHTIRVAPSAPVDHVDSNTASSYTSQRITPRTRSSSARTIAALGGPKLLWIGAACIFVITSCIVWWKTQKRQSVAPDLE